LKLGVIVPQGWTGEYAGWDPETAWARSVAVARRADEVGFDSIWMFDHFHTTPDPTDAPVFESYTSLTALATATRAVRLGHVVTCAGFRNPALLAKMVSTMDVISGGRMMLGIGAGWKEEEWRAYGYGFPDKKGRLDRLEDTVEIATRMFGPGRATYSGKVHSVEDAINEPKPLQQPRVPIMVGGNGRQVTWRLAARFADELNLDSMTPGDVREALPVIAQRCEEVGRDPQTLPVSIHIWRKDPERNEREPLGELLGQYAELGLVRAIALLPGIEDSDEPLYEYAEAGRGVGLELRPGSAAESEPEPSAGAHAAGSRS
jgi:F420-dependent oxidoreductase-like protein